MYPQRKLDKIKALAEKMGFEPSNHNSRRLQTNQSFGSAITRDKYQPSYADLGISSDSRTEVQYWLGFPLNSLPSKRSKVIFKVTVLMTGEIVLYPNPQYRELVKEIAAQFKVRVGKDLFGYENWEDLTDGTPPDVPAS